MPERSLEIVVGRDATARHSAAIEEHAPAHRRYSCRRRARLSRRSTQSATSIAGRRSPNAAAATCLLRSRRAVRRRAERLFGEVHRLTVTGLRNVNRIASGSWRSSRSLRRLEVAERLRHLATRRSSTGRRGARSSPVVSAGISASLCAISFSWCGKSGRSRRRECRTGALVEQRTRHRPALDVPAGTARPRVRTATRLAGFRELPEREVERIALVLADSQCARPTRARRRYDC